MSADTPGAGATEPGSNDTPPGTEHPECNLTEAGKGWGVPPRA